MTMTSEQRQIIQSALLSTGHYDYPLTDNAHVYLYVGENSNGYYWARWVLEITESGDEIFERSRRRRFRKREDAAYWLYQEYNTPWTDMGPKLNISGPVPRPRK